MSINNNIRQILQYSVLYNLYIEECFTPNKIAKLYNVRSETIVRLLREYNIPIKTLDDYKLDRSKERFNNFLTKSNKAHDFKYDYSLVKFINMSTDIDIICPIHGIFTQNPNNHARGNGCDQCATVTRQDTMENKTRFRHALQNPNSKKKLKDTMLDRYNIEHNSLDPNVIKKRLNTNIEKLGVPYPLLHPTVNEKRKQTMIARYGAEYTLQSDTLREKFQKSIFEKYGSWWPSQCDIIKQRIINTNISKYGAKYVTQSPIIRQRVIDTNMDRYGVYNISHLKIIESLPKLTNYEWLYDQYVIQYKSASQIARELGNVYYGTVIGYLRKFNIEIRQLLGFSCMSIKWLNDIMLTDSVDIQHALNGGEYKIPGTRYTADGYCVETNTIYEFHGDVFHGNPILFESTEYCHPFNKGITAGELYERTMLKEQTIRELGYNLITIWETDWITNYEQN